MNCFTHFLYANFTECALLAVPVIFIGVLDRNISDHVLVAVPELYRYGREGSLFGLKRFFAYMIDGTYQVRFSPLFQNTYGAETQ